MGKRSPGNRVSWEAAIEHLMSQGVADREQAQTVIILSFMERAAAVG
jgi:hypothetical protein